MTMILDRTTVLCRECGTSHAATIERVNDRVLGRVRCVHGTRAVELSGHAELYALMRDRAMRRPAVNNPQRPRSINLLPVTQHCNLRCPVCYASAGPESTPRFLSVAEAEVRMRDAKLRGARVVSLTGGEATLHPELPVLIRRARGLGLRVFLVSNGLRFAHEPGLARVLKRAGLSRVSMQFDTLDPETLRRLRGIDDVEAKCRAARNVVAAGLRLGLIATVTKHSLPALGDVIEFGLSLGPALGSITLQAATSTGRFDVGADSTVDKEQIVEQVLRATGATADDVWPLPVFAPWGLSLHPDCGVNLIVLTDRERRGWLRECVDVPALHRRLACSNGDRHWAARNLRPLRHVLATARPGQRGRLLGHLTGFVTGRGRRGMTIIGIGAFCQREFLDESRLAGCAADELTANGGVSPCLVYSGGT